MGSGATSDDRDAERQDVLSSLPHSRPQRRSAKRDSAAAARKRPAKAEAEAKAKPRPKPKAAPKRRTAGRASGAAKSAAPGARTVGGVKPSAATRHAARTGRAAPSGPSGIELVEEAVQAAGELARIGIGMGISIVRAASERVQRR